MIQFITINAYADIDIFKFSTPVQRGDNFHIMRSNSIRNYYQFRARTIRRYSNSPDILIHKILSILLYKYNIYRCYFVQTFENIYVTDICYIATKWSYSAFNTIVNFVADSSTAREVCTAALSHTDNTTEQ